MGGPTPRGVPSTLGPTQTTGLTQQEGLKELPPLDWALSLGEGHLLPLFPRSRKERGTYPKLLALSFLAHRWVCPRELIFPLSLLGRLLADLPSLRSTLPARDALGLAAAPWASSPTLVRGKKLRILVPAPALPKG